MAVAVAVAVAGVAELPAWLLGWWLGARFQVGRWINFASNDGRSLFRIFQLFLFVVALFLTSTS